MSAVLQSAALACTALGLVAAVLVLASARDGRASMQVLLDFLLAAGLLRLSAEPGWTQIAAAAALVALRRLLAGPLRG